MQSRAHLGIMSTLQHHLLGLFAAQQHCEARIFGGVCIHVVVPLERFLKSLVLVGGRHQNFVLIGRASFQFVPHTLPGQGDRMIEEQSTYFFVEGNPSDS